MNVNRSQELGDDPDPSGIAGAHESRSMRLGFLGLVALGGVVGTALREVVTLAIPTVSGIPVAVFVINIVGACGLGFLLVVLASRGPDEGARRTVRLLVGTGLAGGFTTYSALAGGTAGLILRGDLGSAFAYALATVVGGALATCGGMALAAVSIRGARRADSDGPLSGESE